MTTTINERDAVTIAIRTAHGYLWLQPTGAIEFRSEAGSYETFTIEGLASLLAPLAGNTTAPIAATPQSQMPTGSTPSPATNGQVASTANGLASGDAIDLSRATIAARDCPDVRHWPIFAPLTLVEFAATECFERGDLMVDFPGRDALPPANGNQGPIAYTLWMGCRIADPSDPTGQVHSDLTGRGGEWYIAPIVECIRTYVPTGRMLAPNQVATNLFYYAEPPLRRYQPSPGESIALFCTTGDTRRQNVEAVQVPARTNVVIVPFQVGRYIGEGAN